MTASTASMVLLWAVVLTLSFACAGLRAQIRMLQSSAGERRFAMTPVEQDVDRAELLHGLVPDPPARVSLVLIVDSSCPSCDEAVPVFDEAVGTLPLSQAFVLTRDPLKSTASAELRFATVVVDSAMHQYLNPGWLPALAVLDDLGSTRLIEPVGSPTALRTVVSSDRIRDLV